MDEYKELPGPSLDFLPAPSDRTGLWSPRTDERPPFAVHPLRQSSVLALRQEVRAASSGA